MKVLDPGLAGLARSKRTNRKCDPHYIRTSVRFLSDRHGIRSGHVSETLQHPLSRLFLRHPIKGVEMKIACCTMEMIALIFLLFVSINGGFSYINAPRTDLISESTTELVSAWGEPDSVAVATELGFDSSQLETVEIWSYDDPVRSVVVRNNVVVSIRMG